MTPMDAMTPLERQFHQDMLEGSVILKRQHGYNPTYFLQMVAEFGGVEAVRRLLKTPNYQDGLTTLWELQRLDMSCEAAVLNPKYATLFTDAERREARKRLGAMAYEPHFD